MPPLFFERPDESAEALLVQLEFTGPAHARGDDDADVRREEFRHLARSAGYIEAGIIGGTRREPHPRHYVGVGKLDEIETWLHAHPEVGVVMFNHDLSPAQERNLEQRLECRVLTRTGLILNVFGERARTHEGKLQVELAQLSHASTRLVRGWTHLDRQKGGVNLRGAGETQLELDQRMLAQRIRRVRARLERVRTRRGQSRRRRQRVAVPTVVLVGYTNAGKSTLFNRLSSARVLAADQLFATLDPTLRRVLVPGVGEAMLVDTVGFIRDLPHELIEAFRATLEEVAEADLLLHIMDASAEDVLERKDEVEKVLAEIGAEAVPRLEVVNKVDLLGEGEGVLSLHGGSDNARVAVSAASGHGMEALMAAIGAGLAGRMTERELTLQPSCGRVRAELYARDAVLQEEFGAGGEISLTVRMAPNELERLAAQPGVSLRPAAG